jgi:hypothetical protein
MEKKEKNMLFAWRCFLIGLLAMRLPADRQYKGA